MPFVSGSGRKQAPEWSEVLEIENSSRVKCKSCNSFVSKKIERIRSHLSTCNKYNSRQHVEVELEELEENSEDMGLDTSVLSSTSSTSLTSPSGMAAAASTFFASRSNKSDNSSRSNHLKRMRCSMPKLLQPSMKDFTISTTDAQRQMLDKKIADFFYGNNIAFNVAESEQYKEMIRALRPGYTPPNRHKLGGSLLDEANKDVDDKLKKELANSSITLMQDGWSSVRNDPIIAMSIHTGKTAFLLNATECGSEKKTAEYCAEVAMDAIAECEEKFGAKVFAICTDNENKMIKMKEILKEEHSHLLTYGCSSHYLNLLEKNVTPTSVIKHIVETHKYFRNVHQAHGWLKELNGLMPQLPNDTRWNSQEECVSTFVSNYHKYKEIQTTQTDFKRDISRILDDVNIYREAIMLQKQLREVSRALDKLQSDDASLSSAVETWLDLRRCHDLDPYKKNIDNRMKLAMEPFHYLSNMIDPKYQGKRLNGEQEKAAEDWLAQHYPEYIPGILAFKIQDDAFFPQSMFHQDVVNQFSAAKWWKITDVKSKKIGKLPPTFCCFFSSLLSCPASSASIERVFSTFGLVWTKLRNRLGVEKAEKLVKVYRYLRAEPKDW